MAEENRRESFWQTTRDVPSPPLIAAIVVVLALSYLTLVRGEGFRFWVHDGLALLGGILLLYAAHAPPTPELWRRRLIALCVVISWSAIISG